MAFFKPCRRLVPLGCILLISEVEPDELVAMNSVKSEDDHHDEVGNQEACVEGVPPVEMLERFICVVRLPVVPEALWREQQPENRREWVKGREQVIAPAMVALSNRFYAIRCRLHFVMLRLRLVQKHGAVERVALSWLEPGVSNDLA